MTERTTSTVACDKFEFGKGEDFAEWVEVFTRAVHNATNPQTNDRKDQVLLDWLPLCLNKEASHLFKSATSNTWDDLKAELIRLFEDKDEAYRWKTNPNAYRWNQKDSLSTVAAKIKRNVDKYQKELESANGKKDAYYCRFYNAMPKEYRTAIDLGIKTGEESIENAVEIAKKVQRTKRANDDRVEFEAAGAEVDTDRLKAVEMGIASVQISLKKLEARDQERSRGRDKSRDQDRSRDQDKSRDQDRSRGQERSQSFGRPRERDNWSRGRSFERGRSDSGSWSRDRNNNRDRQRRSTAPSPSSSDDSSQDGNDCGQDRRDRDRWNRNRRFKPNRSEWNCDRKDRNRDREDRNRDREDRNRDREDRNRNRDDRDGDGNSRDGDRRGHDRDRRGKENRDSDSDRSRETHDDRSVKTEDEKSDVDDEGYKAYLAFREEQKKKRRK
jgi:hypothetical protein